MMNTIQAEAVKQASKYCPFLETMFGERYDVIPSLVLTRTADLYTYTSLPDSEAELLVCSGDMLFNLLDEYLGMLQK